MIVHFSINDLIEINIAAKAFKQRRFMLINHNNKPMLVGLDRYKIFVSTSDLNPEKITQLPSNIGFIFVQSDLAKFITNLSIENDIPVNTDIAKNLSVSFMGNAGMYIEFDKKTNNDILNILNRIETINETIDYYALEEDVTDRLESMYTHHKSDGGVYFVHNGYYITLSYGILPLNKGNKIYLSIIDNDQCTFTTRFRVDKKKANVYSYITYRKL